MEYIWSIEELPQKAIEKLGSMNAGTYQGYLSRARALTSNPLLVIDIKFNEKYQSRGLRDQPYPIAEHEWDRFVEDAKEMAEYCPNVYVVDGSKYTAPI